MAVISLDNMRAHKVKERRFVVEIKALGGAKVAIRQFSSREQAMLGSPPEDPSAMLHLAAVIAHKCLVEPQLDSHEELLDMSAELIWEIFNACAEISTSKDPDELKKSSDET